MNKKGFTLVELIAVIVVIALLITIASSSVLAIMNRGKNGLTTVTDKNLEDAAVTYALKHLSLPTCPTTFNLESPTGSCFTRVKVQELKEKDFFEDNSNHCNPNATVLIYHYNDGTNTEYRAKVSEGTCNN